MLYVNGINKCFTSKTDILRSHTFPYNYKFQFYKIQFYKFQFYYKSNSIWRKPSLFAYNFRQMKWGY